VINKLNQQYKANDFQSNLTARELIKYTEHVMRGSIDAIDYELNQATIDQYGIKTKYC
jgi:hypothetical protein